jgi:hypothetical protein
MDYPRIDRAGNRIGVLIQPPQAARNHRIYLTGRG